MKTTASLSLTALLLVLFVSSCASGPVYRDVAKTGALTPRKGNGLILMYKVPPPLGVVGAADPGVYLYANNVQLPGKLLHGGFYSYEAPPGPLHLACSGQEGESTGATQTSGAVSAAVIGGLLAAPITIPVAIWADKDAHRHRDCEVNVHSNETHYLQLNWGKLTEVPREKGEKDIRPCHWINAPSR